MANPWKSWNLVPCVLGTCSPTEKLHLFFGKKKTHVDPQSVACKDGGGEGLLSAGLDGLYLRKQTCRSTNFFIWNLYLYNFFCPLRICAGNIMKYVCICSFCCGIRTPSTYVSVHFYRFQPEDCNLLCQKIAMFSVKSIGKKSQAQLSGMQALKEVFPAANSAQAPNSWHSSRSFWIFISSPPKNWITKAGILKTSWFCSSLNNHHDKWVIEVLQFGLVDCHSTKQNWLLIKSDHLGTLNSSPSVPLPWVWEEKYHAKNICFFLPYLC